MLRATVSKVMWVGRATVFLVGLAVIMAVVLGLATAALAGTGVGAAFDLGKINTVNRLSQLVGSTDNAMLRLDNNNTGTGATALNLQVEPGHAPMQVNSTTKVARLNADAVDGASVEHGQVDVPAGGSQTILALLNPNVKITYYCPATLSNTGVVQVDNPGAETINVFIEQITQAKYPSMFFVPIQSGSFYARSSDPGGEHTTYQLQQGNSQATIDVFAAHRSGDCHVQAQAVVWR
jgi:hypothetical protein